MASLFHIDMLTWFTIVVAVIVGYVLKRLMARTLSPLSKIPGPPTWSPLGHTSTIMKEPTGEPHFRWNQQYGDIFRYQFPIYEQRIAILNPDYIKHVLVTQSTKYIKPPVVRRFLLDAIGEGLVLLEGQKHARARKILNPAFKYIKIKEMVPIVLDFSQALADYWQNLIDEKGPKATLNIHSDLSRAALDAICKCGFGYDSNSLTDPDNEVSSAFEKVLSLNLSWTFFVPGFKHLPIPSNLRVKKALSTCHNTIAKVIDQKSGKGDTGEDKCMLDILLSLKDEETNTGFTRTELQHHIMTFMSAGHETTSAALAWTLYALALHPTMQERARQDILDLKQRGVAVTWDALDELSYLENVIKESLRLYSPVHAVLRLSTVDDKIGDYFIPKGTIVTIVPPHRSAKYFEDPLKFDPDRWDTTAKYISPYAYLPFLRGPRMCIGFKFALMEVKCMLFALLSQFSFEPCPDREVKRKLRLAMAPHPSLKLVVSPLSSD